MPIAGLEIIVQNLEKKRIDRMKSNLEGRRDQSDLERFSLTQIQRLAPPLSAYN